MVALGDDVFAIEICDGRLGAHLRSDIIAPSGVPSSISGPIVDGHIQLVMGGRPAYCAVSIDGVLQWHWPTNTAGRALSVFHTREPRH